VTSLIREDGGHGYGAWSLRDLWVELGRCSWRHCGRNAAREREETEENTDPAGATEMLVISGSESSIEVRGLAEYPSHGGSQGFKSPHLHPHKSPGHRSRRVRPAGAVPSPRDSAGSKRAATTSDIASGLAMREAWQRRTRSSSATPRLVGWARVGLRRSARNRPLRAVV
jgi:hypothetical protein